MSFLRKLILISLYFIKIPGDSTAQRVEWFQHIRPGGNEYVWDINVDDSGNVYSTGRVKFTSTFGYSPNQVTPSAIGVETDVFLAKYSNSGELQFALREGGYGPDWGRSIEIDKDQNIIIVGDYCDSANFGSVPLIAQGTSLNRNLFIVKYDRFGNGLWALTAGNAANHSRAYTVDSDADGNLYVGGHISGASSISNGTIGVSNVDRPFLIKLGPNGNFIWGQTLPASFGGEINEVLVKDSTLYFIGSFRGTINLGGTVFTGQSPSWRDVMVAKLDTSGSYYWATVFTGAYNDQGASIDVDDSGNVYALGTFANDLNFGSGGILNSYGTSASAATANANQDGFMCKIVNGQVIWVRQLGAPHTVGYSKLTVDPVCKTIYSTGKFIPNTELVGDGILSSTDSTFNILLLAVDFSGNYLWHNVLGGNGNDNADGIVLDSSGKIFLGGHFDQSGVFDTINVVAQSGVDAFVLSLLPPVRPSILSVDSVICLSESGWVDFCQPGPIDSVFVLPDGQEPTVFNYSFHQLDFQYSVPGVYSPSIVFSNGLESDTLVLSISVHGTALPFLPGDTVLCPYDQFLVSAPVSADSVLWSGGQNSGSISVSTSGLIWLDAYEQGCVSRDSLVVDILPADDLISFTDTLICSDAILVLNLGSNYSNVEWSTGDLGNTLIIDTTGIFSVLATDLSGCEQRDTVQVLESNCAYVEDRDLLSDVTLYPNPGRDQIAIRSSDIPNHIEVFDLSGRKIAAISPISYAGGVSLFSGHLPAGAYRLRILFSSGEYWVFYISQP